MAKSKGNPTLKGVRGQIGKTLHVRQRKDGMTILSNMPGARNRNRIPPGQRRGINNFVNAASFARDMMTKPEMKALYSHGVTITKTAAYRVALSDYLNAPKIHYIRTRDYTGTPGDLISVKATDDFRVVRVEVKVFSSEGKLIEKGEAVNVRLKPLMWRYRTTLANPAVKGSMIKARAYDRPGNECEMVFNFD